MGVGAVSCGSWRRAVLACAFAAAGAAAHAGPDEGFLHKDWYLRCDNTRTCRAEGYQAEGGESPPVSLQLSRAAGPGTPVQARLQVYADDAVPGVVRLQVGSLVIPKLDLGAPQIPQAEVPPLLQALLRADEATVTAGKTTWRLSLAGANAVLLKMDERQGRVGTSGALVRKGPRDEASVLPPLQAPVVRAVVPVPTRKADAALVAPLLAALDRGAVESECGGNPMDPAGVRVHRLTERRVLLELPCLMGAYNAGSLLFMANDRPPYQPVVVADVDGEFDPSTGTATASMKGRGIGDCWSVREWRFNGQGFTLSAERADGMCRGFPGGAWQTPVYVSR